MKKLHKISIFLILLLIIGIYNSKDFIIDYKRSVHLENLKNSPVKQTYKLSKTERKKINLPPNQYQEKIWELSMNPMTGKPDIDDLFEIQYKLKESNEVDVRAFTVPGESEEMKWLEVQ